VISGDVRCAIARAVAAEGLGPADPGLRPTGVAGQYASSVAFAFSERPRRAATRIAARLAETEGIAKAEVTGPGFITVTVTAEALAGLPERIATAGPACVASDALRGTTVPAPPQQDPLAAATWEEAREALVAQLTARLAAAAGATPAPSEDRERAVSSPDPDQLAVGVEATEVARAVAFAGADAVRFSLARAVPGRPALIDPRIIARHVLDNPAYAVRYAHGRAASGMRWAASAPEDNWKAQRTEPGDIGGYGSQGGRGAPGGMGEVSPLCEGTAPHAGSLPPREITALVDALSWLPERVAAAARRGRPDEFARYLEELASATIAALISVGDPGTTRAPGTGRLAMARAARTGLAAGLGLLGVGAPDRLC